MPTGSASAPAAVLKHATAADAKTQIGAAQAAAKVDGKPVLLSFGAKSCAECAAMDRALGTPAAQSILARSYHLVRIDSAQATGMPVLVVLSPSGAIRVDTTKGGNPAFDEAHVVAFLKHWSA